MKDHWMKEENLILSFQIFNQSLSIKYHELHLLLEVILFYFCYYSYLLYQIVIQ